MFKKIMPSDIGLEMIERVLFLKDDLDWADKKRDFPAPFYLPIEQDRRVEEAFERIFERVQTMNRFLEANGSPRRFRDRRLMRLIFLSVQKRTTQPTHSHHHHLQEQYPSPQAFADPISARLE